MNRLLLLVLALASSLALADGQLEIFRLKHRSADQVIEVLRPLLERGGSITGTQDKIMVRASAENRAQIRQALAAIDTAPRRLVVTVQQDNVARRDGSSVWSTRGSSADRSSQQVQVVEGGRAFIQVGYSFPLPLRETVFGPGGAVVSEAVVYRDIASGFYAQPQLAGDRVTLEISPQQESLSSTEPGAVRGSRLGTTVTGRLGEWIELGGANQVLGEDRPGSRTYSTRGRLDLRRVLLKVDELR